MATVLRETDGQSFVLPMVRARPMSSACKPFDGESVVRRGEKR